MIEGSYSSPANLPTAQVEKSAIVLESRSGMRIGTLFFNVQQMTCINRTGFISTPFYSPVFPLVAPYHAPPYPLRTEGFEAQFFSSEAWTHLGSAFISS